MADPPQTLDGATVLRFADVSRIEPLGRTRHVVGGCEVSRFAGLALASYEDDPGVYLFYCDDNWSVVTDTYHENMDRAIAQAEFEFGRVRFQAYNE